MTSHKAVACRYLRGWFILDLIASFPFDLLVSGGGGGGTSLVKMFKLPRLLRAMKVARLLKTLPFQREMLSLLGILQMLFVVMLLSRRGPRLEPTHLTLLRSSWQKN